MEYIYPPLYKYLAIILLYFMFLRNYKSIDQENYLLLSTIFTSIIILMDYYLIDSHANLLSAKFTDFFEDIDTSDTEFIIDDDMTNTDDDNENNVSVVSSDES
jgi:hypothetical protein